MKKFIGLITLLAVGLAAGAISAQSTTVSTTGVIDSDSLTWSNGTYQITFVPNPSSPNPNNYIWSGGNLQQNSLFTGSLNGSGVFSLSIPTSTAITPSGSQWKYTICPNATSGCFSVNIPAVGSTQDVTPTLNLAAKGPRFAANPTAFGYGTIEVSPNPLPGAFFYNTTTATCYQFPATGTTWVSCGGGSGSGYTGNVNLTNQIGVYANGALQSFGNPFGMSITCVAGGVTIGSGTFELGYATTNPNVCTLSYSNGTAASASVSDGTNSYTDTTPYTVFTGAYSYTANTTFSASATSTTSQTATATKAFAVSSCTFTGLTTNAAPTGATASGSGAGNQCASETVTLTGGGTLTSHGLGSTTVGTVFSFASPGGDYITLFLTETSSGCNRNPFTFNGSSPVNGTTQAISSYTNILGGVQTNMCLYTFGPYSSAVTLTVGH